jgi:hypothetical protein
MKLNPTHPCGLTTLAVRQHETGSRPLGKAGRCALENWQEAERLKLVIQELKKENALLKRLNSNNVYDPCMG